MRQQVLYLFIIFTIANFSIYGQSSKKKSAEYIAIQKLEKSHYKKKENYYYYGATKLLDSALNISISAGYSRKTGRLYTLKAQLLHEINENDEAINILNKALKIQYQFNDKKNLGRSFKVFGDIYASQKKYNQALDAYNTSTTLFTKKKMTKELAEVLLSAGKLHLMYSNYTKAKVLLEQSIDLSVKHQKNLAKALINLANLYNETGKHEEALKKANDALTIARQCNSRWLKVLAYNSLGDINTKLKKHKEANSYYKKYISSSDKLKIVKENNIKIHKINKSVIENQSIKLKKTKEKLDIEKDKNLFGVLISILSVSLVIILSLFTLSLYRNNKIRLRSNNMLYKKNIELTKAKEKAELASKTKANFLSTVTHELRTPLYAVTGLSSMLLDENPRQEQIQHLKSLKFSGDYLLTFINDILQINKIEANKVDVEEESFNLRKKIDNIILALKNSAEDNNVKIHFSYPKALPENFIADQLKISQILINLIGNSIKFTNNGYIWIRVYNLNKNKNTYNLRFEIEDNGIGISEEKQGNIFESFSQGSIQINRKYGGTGLGLSIVKGLIDILKGNIYLKSTLNKGTTFFFELPLKVDTEFKELGIKRANHSQNDISSLDLNRVKILVVEDNKINQMITKKILTKMKLNCEVVDNGEDAVNLVKNNDYSLILMDIHMPGISGIEATKRIRAFDKNLTIFALTAVTIEDKIQEFNDAGFTDIIPKPFKQAEFEKKLFNALIKGQNTNIT